MKFFKRLAVKIARVFRPKPSAKARPTPAPKPVEPTKPVEKTVLQRIYERAFAELNVTEKSPGDNPRIVEYHSVTTLKASDDETPWCASFVSWVLEKEGIKSTKSAWARSYLQWGRPTQNPEKGCVVVFSRGNNPSTGHVAFYAYETDTQVWVLGGNQGNRVSVAPYSKSRVLGYRLPV